MSAHETVLELGDSKYLRERATKLHAVLGAMHGPAYDVPLDTVHDSLVLAIAALQERPDLQQAWGASFVVLRRAGGSPQNFVVAPLALEVNGFALEVEKIREQAD